MLSVWSSLMYFQCYFFWPLNIPDASPFPKIAGLNISYSRHISEYLSSLWIYVELTQHFKISDLTQLNLETMLSYLEPYRGTCYIQKEYWVVWSGLILLTHRLDYPDTRKWVLQIQTRAVNSRHFYFIEKAIFLHILKKMEVLTGRDLSHYSLLWNVNNLRQKIINWSGCMVKPIGVNLAICSS